MSKIRSLESSTPFILPSRCLIGRSSACDLRLESPETSAEHALMRWRNGVWEIQDLNSRNGTYIDGRRLVAGRLVGLSAGARLGFGLPERHYTLCDDGPPRLHAVGLHPPHPTIEAEGDLLALPGDDPVEATVYRRERQWWLERDEGLTPITDRALVHTQAGAWWVHLPEPPPATRDAEGVAPSLANLALRFVLGEDGAIELFAARGDARIDLKARTYHALLLALARARINDEPSSHDAGWVEQEALLQQLGYDANRFHVEVHRIRRLFSTVGVLDAARIIERREGTRQFRIGVDRLEII